jgi:hypothetical protein
MSDPKERETSIPRHALIEDIDHYLRDIPSGSKRWATSHLIRSIEKHVDFAAVSSIFGRIADHYAADKHACSDQDLVSMEFDTGVRIYESLKEAFDKARNQAFKSEAEADTLRKDLDKAHKELSKLPKECWACGKTVNVLDGKYAEHESSICNGSHVKWGTCTQSGKKVRQ